ncbi:ROK family transcriptional regulator [Solibacillus sp. FSL K6-4121]|uniref:ROK family transcriptional regulator n=1 Tax=Solibacillus sp. FSL K6-4121 TaxID=2921505 RepID=UPI0030FCC3A6
MAGAGVLRIANKKSIIKLIRENPNISRKELAKILNVSKNTVSLAVEELLTEKIVEEKSVSVLEKGRGRPKVALDIQADNLKILSVNLKKDEVHICIYNYRTDLIFEQVFAYEGELKEVTNILVELERSFGKFIGITVIVPGIVDSLKGMVIYSEKLKWKNIDVVLKLKKYLESPIYIQNNVKCMAIYQAWKNNDTETIYYLKIDQGIGSALIVNGEIWAGAFNVAGEISHIKLENGQTLEERCNTKNLENKTVEQRKQLIKNIASNIAQVLKHTIVLINPNRLIIESQFCEDNLFQTEIWDTLNEQLLDEILKHLFIDFNTRITSPLIGGAILTIYEYEKVEGVTT